MHACMQIFLVIHTQVIVDKEAHAELMWGLSGAAALFGIVTRLVFRLHDMSNFYGGLIMWPDDPGHQTWRYAIIDHDLDTDLR